jgi:hypothetical protein
VIKCDLFHTPVTVAALGFQNTSPVIFLEIAMAVIAKGFSRASGTLAHIETLKIIGIFSGIGLLVSLFALSCGLDLSGVPF